MQAKHFNSWDRRLLTSAEHLQGAWRGAHYLSVASFLLFQTMRVLLAQPDVVQLTVQHPGEPRQSELRFSENE